MGRGGDGAATYMLDGKDAKSEVAGPGGAMVPVTTNGKIDGWKACAFKLEDLYHAERAHYRDLKRDLGT
jgi:hypothetical protein